MKYISALPIGEVPCEENVPTNVELTDLAKIEPRLVEVYPELMCHYLACNHYYNTYSGMAFIRRWFQYLFNNISNEECTQI